MIEELTKKRRNEMNPYCDDNSVADIRLDEGLSSILTKS